jgi:hypothetical protein
MLFLKDKLARSQRVAPLGRQFGGGFRMLAGLHGRQRFWFRRARVDRPTDSIVRRR